MWFLIFIFCNTVDPCEAVQLPKHSQQNCMESQRISREIKATANSMCLRFDSREEAAQAASDYNRRAKETNRKE